MKNYMSAVAYFFLAGSILLAKPLKPGGGDAGEVVLRMSSEVGTIMADYRYGQVIDAINNRGMPDYRVQKISVSRKFNGHHYELVFRLHLYSKRRKKELGIMVYGAQYASDRTDLLGEKNQVDINNFAVEFGGQQYDMSSLKHVEF
jgi:hypothetical protein